MFSESAKCAKNKVALLSAVMVMANKRIERDMYLIRKYRNSRIPDKEDLQEIAELCLHRWLGKKWLWGRRIVKIFATPKGISLLD